MSPIIQDLPNNPRLITIAYTRTCDMCERVMKAGDTAWYESSEDHPEWSHAFIAHRRCLRPSRW